MIIDIGGGTADLVTYRIIRLDPLALEEACVGQGKRAVVHMFLDNTHR